MGSQIATTPEPIGRCLRILVNTAKNNGIGQPCMPASEVLIPTPTIVDLMREGKIHEVEYYIKDGGMYGMQTFNQVLLDLYRAGKITKDVAINFAEKKDELMMGLKELR